jgi:hypothetical protein
MKQRQGETFNHSIGGKLFLRRSGHAFCPVCSKQVELISFADAADLFHTDLQDIQFLTNRGEVHQVHNRKGKVMVCAVSLFECFDNRRTRLLDSSIFDGKASEKSVLELTDVDIEANKIVH